MKRSLLLLFLSLSGALLFWRTNAQDSSAATQEFDVLIKGGTVYDGTGAEGRVADVAIRGDRIVGVGNFGNARAKRTVDAHGLAVARASSTCSPGRPNRSSLMGARRVRFGKA